MRFYLCFHTFFIKELMIIILCFFIWNTLKKKYQMKIKKKKWINLLILEVYKVYSLHICFEYMYFVLTNPKLHMILVIAWKKKYPRVIWSIIINYTDLRNCYLSTRNVNKLLYWILILIIHWALDSPLRLGQAFCNETNTKYKYHIHNNLISVKNYGWIRLNIKNK